MMRREAGSERVQARRDAARRGGQLRVHGGPALHGDGMAVVYYLIVFALVMLAGVFYMPKGADLK